MQARFYNSRSPRSEWETQFYSEQRLMKLNRVVPTLWVVDIEQTVTFYRDVLGFECPNRMEGWACLVNHEVELMVSLPNHHELFGKPGFSGSFYFHPEDVDSL